MKQTNSQPTVIYLHQYFATPKDSGGTRSYEMAKRLVNRGFKVHMVTSRQSLDGVSGHEVIAGIDVHWIAVPYNNTMSFSRRIFSFLQFSLLSSRKVLQLKADLIFATSTPLTIAIPALLGKRIKRVPMVFEVRDLWPELPIAIGALRNKLLIKLANWLEKRAYKESTHVIGLSPGMCEGIMRTGIPRDNVSLIPNSCDFDRFNLTQPQDNTFREHRPWLGDKPLVIYAGTFGLINGVSWLAELAAVVKDLNPDIRFLAIGNGLESSLVKEKAKQLGVLGENFFVEAAIPKEEVPFCLAAASVCCSLFIPLKEMEHNSANKFFDALSSARPILINYGGWHRELVEQHQIGIAARSDDIDQAAKQLVSLIESPEELASAGQRAQALGAQMFARDTLAEKLGNILQNAIDGQPQHSTNDTSNNDKQKHQP